MLEKDFIVYKLVEEVKGTLAKESVQTKEIAKKSYEMGESYAKTKRFDNSRFYHNYQFHLDDGSTVLSSNYFNIFMSRNQTHAYLDAEKAVKCLFDDEDQRLFHLVRDKRIGINGVFKAIMSPNEPQQLNYTDFVLVIAAFCAGVMNR